jgi:hypothetical protein
MSCIIVILKSMYLLATWGHDSRPSHATCVNYKGGNSNIPCDALPLHVLDLP